MPRVCLVCSHPKKSEIELSSSSGVSNRAIERQFSVGHDSVRRHMSNCIKQASKEHIQRKQEAETLDVLAQLIEVNAGTLAIWRACKGNEKTYGLALSASDRLVKQQELYSKLVGDLASGTQVNIQLPAPWETIELAIAGALSAFPDAAVAVADALARVEAGNAGLN